MSGAESVGSGLDCSYVVNRQEGIVILAEADLRTDSSSRSMKLWPLKVYVVWKRGRRLRHASPWARIHRGI